MNSINHILSDLLGQVSGFFFNALLPWAWDNKMWISTIIPLVVIIAIAKWIWD